MPLRCPPGNVVVTGAGDLPAQWVLHAVGPVYLDGHHGEPGELAACYAACLEQCRLLRAHSVTLPAISTGVFGYPLAPAAAVAVQTVAELLAKGGTTVQRVTFVLFDYGTFQGFARALLNTVPRQEPR